MLAWNTMNTQPTFPSGLYYCGGSGSYRSCHPYGSLAFAPWEVALTVVLAALVVATAFIFVRRLRRA